MNTFLSFLAVFLVAALLLAPSLWGALRDHRIDRQLRAARQREQLVRDGRPRTPARGRAPRAGVRHAAGH
ncbi:hypothetical protein ACWCQL_06010 [Streptomyces sp. NPDC002073]|uniref:hypothetical protein n=1 Tax=Streptomyces sp. NBC_00239 TaxID=2903640 RepID=UPI002E2C92D6|nr:hypothetical protein [Streptomyces sp. NBC_00239]